MDIPGLKLQAAELLQLTGHEVVDTLKQQPSPLNKSHPGSAIDPICVREKRLNHDAFHTDPRGDRIQRRCNAVGCLSDTLSILASTEQQKPSPIRASHPP